MDGPQVIPKKLQLHQPVWNIVYTIPKGTLLEKGRHGLYHEITAAAGVIKQTCGCYAWAASNDEVHYCGSFAAYNRPEFASSLHGRVHNYLQNHRISANTGRMNTNLMVFELINEQLRKRSVSLCFLKFNSLALGNEEIDFAEYSKQSTMVQAVERLLIAGYKRIGQCAWNRV